MKIRMIAKAGLPSVALVWLITGWSFSAEDFPKPYDRHCTERENLFEFTQPPRARDIGDDRYEITFAVKAYCDVTVGMIDKQGKVARHLGSGVLGANAPAPFQKSALKQKIYWDTPVNIAFW